MMSKQFLVFVILCLVLDSKVQGKSIKPEVLQRSTISNKKQSATSEMKLKLQDGEEQIAKEIKAQDNQNESEQHTNSSHMQPVFHISEMSLNGEDEIMLQNLNDIIQKLADTSNSTEVTREGKSFKDERYTKAAEALTDNEITEIIKSISLPNYDDITEDSEALKRDFQGEIEPRSAKMERTAKALQRSHGYYVIVFTPIGDENNNIQSDTVRYSRLHILPADRAMHGEGRDNPRLISKKAWNKYIRRIMRQIRRGTRLIQRKTKVRSLQEKPTVDNFFKRMYAISQEQQNVKKKSSWFTW